jgi:hypothetical protein
MKVIKFCASRNHLHSSDYTSPAHPVHPLEVKGNDTESCTATDLHASTVNTSGKLEPLSSSKNLCLGWLKLLAS